MAAVDSVQLDDRASEAVFAALSAELNARGVQLVDKWWGVGGSVEISQWTFSLDDSEITVESETFDGLTISGEGRLVHEIAACVARRLEA